MTDKTLNPAPITPISDPPHPRSWQKLETIGDCRRGLRWIFMQTKAGKLDSRKAATMAVILSYIVKTVELEDLEARILALEADQQNTQGDRTIRIFVGGKRDEIA